MLMNAHDARTGTTLNDIEIRDQIMTLLISGIETPATVLTWVLYELAGNPALERRLRAAGVVGREFAEHGHRLTVPDRAGTDRVIEAIRRAR